MRSSSIRYSDTIGVGVNEILQIRLKCPKAMFWKSVFNKELSFVMPIVIFVKCLRGQVCEI